MASGDLINYANFKATHGESWDTSTEGTNSSSAQTTFICAPCFITGLYINSAWALDGITANWTVSYYNGSSWVTVLNENKSTSGINNGYWTKFYHNRSSEGTSSGDKSNYHLWKITASPVSSTGGWTSSLSCKIGAWVGGIAMMTEAEYNNVCKGKLMKGYQPAYFTGSESDFLSNYSPQAKRGTLISVSTGTYKWLGAGDY